MLLSDKVKELVREHLGEDSKRYIHTLGVMEMAEYLAKEYDVDLEKAKIAALMHDYSKYDPVSDASLYLTLEEREDCKKYPFLYHAYLSACAYKRLVGDDNDIYLAIKNHVFGRPGMTILEKIIMISDYTEKNREYESCIECRKILLAGHLDEAIYKSTLDTINFNELKNKKPHPRQLEVLKEYERKLNK